MVNSNSYGSETPHFFQVIMPDALQQGKLDVPSKFVRKYGVMSFAGRKSVHLVMPNADTWTVAVEISARDKKVMLGEGWEEFTDHYSLGVGSFVVFRFEPVESVFAVSIFDESSIEINYHPPKPAAAAAAPSATAHRHRVRIKEENIRSESESKSSDEYQDTEDEDDDDEDEDEDDDEDEDEDDEDDDDEDEDDVLPETGTQANPVVIDYEAQAHMQKLRSKLLKSMPLRKAFIGKTGNPCFRLKIKRSYLQPKNRVTLPLQFVLKNKLDKELKVRLRLVGYGKIWPMRICYRVSPRERRGELSKGWHKFCREVGIRVGDRCEFELTSRVRNMVFFTMSIIG